MGWVSFKYERPPSICYWCGCLTHGDKDCELWINSEGRLIAKDRNYGAWFRAPLSNQIRKSTIVVPGFFQQKKVSKVSQNSESTDLSKPHQTPSLENRASTGSLDKVNSDSLPQDISNDALYPNCKDLDDPLLGFGGQISAEVNFTQTL